MNCVTTRRAKQSHEEALAIRRKSLPPDHPHIAYSLNNLGDVQDDLREYAACQAELRGGIGDLPQDPAPDHPDIAYSLNNLGNVQDELREYAACEAEL